MVIGNRGKLASIQKLAFLSWFYECFVAIYSFLNELILIPMASFPINQHYVAQAFLRPFSRPEIDSEQVWVYDKLERKSFPSNIRNVAAERYFYNFESGGQAQSLEPAFTELESRWAPILAEIRATDSIAWLSEAERIDIAGLIVIQRIRTSHMRKHIASINQQIIDEIRVRGGDPSNIQGFTPLMEGQEKLVALSSLQSVPEIVPVLLKKDWMLARNDSALPFYISDNPITLHNALHGPLGFGAKGVEINFPISPKLTLTLYCSETVAIIRKRYDKTPTNFKSEEIESLLHAIDSGLATPCESGCIQHYNALQVMHSERWVFSSTNNFDLVNAILADDPNHQLGPRSSIVR